jgi:hypothetical protein
MTRSVRKAGLHLAIVALLLRALSPAGWMPNPAGTADTPFVICTLDGPVLAVDGKGQKQTPDDPRAHESCPFAAAAQLAPATAVATLARPVLHVEFARLRSAFHAEPLFPAHSPQSPRGPPSLI